MTNDLGRWGEERALQFLQQKGYRILARNYRVWEGEIDIVAESDGEIIFVEVKTRTSRRFGYPEDGLIGKKQERLLKAGYRFLEENEMLDVIYQFDLIAIECSNDRKIQRLSHYEDIIGRDMLT